MPILAASDVPTRAIMLCVSALRNCANSRKSLAKHVFGSALIGGDEDEVVFEFAEFAFIVTELEDVIDGGGRGGEVYCDNDGFVVHDDQKRALVAGIVWNVIGVGREDAGVECASGWSKSSVIRLRSASRTLIESISCMRRRMI